MLFDFTTDINLNFVFFWQWDRDFHSYVFTVGNPKFHVPKGYFKSSTVSVMFQNVTFKNTHNTACNFVVQKLHDTCVLVIKILSWKFFFDYVIAVSFRSITSFQNYPKSCSERFSWCLVNFQTYNFCKIESRLK